jgi:hypothetical protein|tara:strand:+ start:219 stop:764 length:546 start_codon:yes stop_codon:yes gene_type:complete
MPVEDDPKLDRPAYGSPELECKLVCDTLSIHDEKANARACYIVANCVHRPQFRQVFMERHYYLKIISYLTPPNKQLIEYLDRNGSCVRKMDMKMQENLNKAACVALTCLTETLKDSEMLRLVHADLIPALLVCYASSSDQREDVKQAALSCLRMYNVSVGHRDPMYPDVHTQVDTYFDRTS